MSIKLEPVIGLEIHVQFTTDSKMFCSCANVFGDTKPNSAICPICLGYPGTLPVPNAIAISWARKVGAALGCELAIHTKFDRKHYFYPDLPKGYQISQFDQPFSGEGELMGVGIERAHLEEDAAKNTHDKKTNSTLVDYNRAGTPLLEIVTKPEIKSPEQAKKFLQTLQKVIRSLGVSTADMEKGQMRCDANISLREPGTTKLNPKTEVKNINSFKNVERALKFEITRQTKEHKEGRVPHAATRGFNADTGVTTEQRSKEEAADYRYFPEPDIPPFVFTEKENSEIIKSIPELNPDKKDRFIRQYGVSDEHAKLFADSDDLANFFENVVSELEQLDREQVAVLPKEVKTLVKMSANIILRNIRKIMEDQDLDYQSLKITPENFAETVVLIHQSKLSKNSLDQVLEEMQKTGGDPDAIIQNLGLEQVSDEGQLEQYVQDVINGNPDIVEKIKAGKDAAIQFLVGQVMAKTRGTGNPGKIKTMLEQKISG